MDDMIAQLDTFLRPGSSLTLMNMVPIFERENRLSEGGLDVTKLKNISLEHWQGNTVLKRHLTRLPLHTFDLIIVLADESDETDTQMADSRTLTTMLLLRELVTREHTKRKRALSQHDIGSMILSEVLDPRTRSLINLANISNYVMSNDLISSALAQVTENRQMNAILSELMSAEGNEVYLKPARLYVMEDEELNFWGVMTRARNMNQCAVGYKLFDPASRQHEEHVLNPDNREVRRAWHDQDMVVVIAED